MVSQKLYEKLKQNRFILVCLVEEIKKITDELSFAYVFKSSSSIVNRTFLSSFRGLRYEGGSQILGRVKKEFGLPLTTYIREPIQVKPSTLGVKSGKDRKPHIWRKLQILLNYRISQKELSDSPDRVYLKNFKSILESIRQ